jgi:membrane protease YdiL (CAAX protease family)
MIARSKTNKHARWPVVAKALLFILGCAVASAVAAPLTRGLTLRWPEFIVGVIGSLWALGLTLVFVRWDGVRLDDVGAKPDRLSLARLVVGFLIGTGMVALWMSISMATGYVHWERAPENGAVMAANTLIAYLGLASREELAFHGYPLRRLEQSFGSWGAQLIVALVFALEHMVGGWPWTRALFGAGVGSLLFGMAAIATRGLAVPIGLHAAWNFGQSMMGLNGEPALWRTVVDNGQEQHVEHVRTIAYLAVMGSAIVAFGLWDRTNLRKLDSNPTI